MVRGVVMGMLLMQQVMMGGHNDPGFLLSRQTFYQLVRENPAAAFCNPAFTHTGGKVWWLAGMANHHGIRQHNTLLAGLGFRDEAKALFLTLKHSALAESDYGRTQAGMGFNLRLSDNIITGAAIRANHFRLPGTYGSSGFIGAMVGIRCHVQSNLSAGLAVGTYRTISVEERSIKMLTQILTDIIWIPSASGSLSLSAEMVSGLRPRVLASFETEVAKGFRMMTGIGTGASLLYVGVSYNTGSLRSMAVSGFNPTVGNSNTFLVSGNYK
jgi:hypothetical protein